MSIELCLIEDEAVFPSCSVVSHVSPKRKWKVESRTEQIYIQFWGKTSRFCEVKTVFKQKSGNV